MDNKAIELADAWDNGQADEFKLGDAMAVELRRLAAEFKELAVVNEAFKNGYEVWKIGEVMHAKPLVLPVTDERKAFEWWYAKTHGASIQVLQRLRDGDSYTVTESGPQLVMSWEAWQARAALQPAQSAAPDDQEPAAYLHRMEKTTVLSFWGEDAECTGSKDWIGFAPLFLHRDKGYLASFAQPAAVPEGWQLVPKEPTPEMVAAYWKERNASGGAPSLRWEWEAVLAAAPQPKENGDD